MVKAIRVGKILNRFALDIIERMAASIRVSNEETNHNSNNDLNYENLSWGFGLQYNNKLYHPKKWGSLVKIHPVEPVAGGVVDPHTGGTLGEFMVIIKPIVFAVEDMSLDLFVQDAMKLIVEEDKTAVAKTRKTFKVAGNYLTKSILIQTPKNPEQRVLTYILRVTGNWYILRWLTTKNDFEKNEQFIESMVKSAYFFTTD